MALLAVPLKRASPTSCDFNEAGVSNCTKLVWRFSVVVVANAAWLLNFFRASTSFLMTVYLAFYSTTMVKMFYLYEIKKLWAFSNWCCSGTADSSKQHYLCGRIINVLKKGLNAMAQLTLKWWWKKKGWRNETSLRYNTIVITLQNLNAREVSEGYLPGIRACVIY